MRTRLVRAGLVCVAAFLMSNAAWARRIEKMAGVLGRNGKPLEVMAEEALVQFAPGTTPAQRAAALAVVGAQVIQEFPALGWTHVGLPPGMTVVAGLNLLKNVPGLINAEPNHVYRPFKVPNDPKIPLQYQLSNINAFAGWEYEVGTSSLITIAVIDAGIEGTHPDLQSKLAGLKHLDCSGASCVPESGTGTTPQVACHHGTEVGGAAAAVTNNSQGVAGVSWGAKLLSLRVFTQAGCNSDCSDAVAPGCTANDPQIANAISSAAVQYNTPTYGRVVVNMSLGESGSCSGILQNAINAAPANMVFVAAAGNSGPSDGTVEAPGNCAGVIPVGATDANDAIASFSSRGPELAANGLVAPGVNVVTTDVNAGYSSNATGTSFASPIVAGAAALIVSAQPTFSRAQVQNTLRNSADSIGVAGFGAAAVGPLGDNSGAGRLDVFRALRLAVKGTLSGFDGDQEAIAFPNPFHPTQDGLATITVPTAVQGRNQEIKIYTIDGQFVRTLQGQSWDGRNQSGNAVATGTYIFRVKTDTGSTRGRVAVIR